MHTNTLTAGVKRIVPDSFQWFPATGQGETGRKLMHRKFHLNLRKNSFTVTLSLPREPVDPPSLEIFKT